MARRTTTEPGCSRLPAGAMLVGHRGPRRGMKILLIEDDAVTAAHLRKGLGEHGHVVDHAAEGREGLFLAAGSEYDVLVVDRMLPQMDGLAIVKTIRAAGVKTPVLFLTTMD